jgi:hypothetical protein
MGSRKRKKKYFGIFLFSVISFAIAFWIIGNWISKDNKERKRLKEHKFIKLKSSLSTTIMVDRVYKSYIYFSTKDARKHIIGPARILDSKRSIFESISSGDSLVKFIDSDTLFVYSKMAPTEKFTLIF